MQWNLIFVIWPKKRSKHKWNQLLCLFCLSASCLSPLVCMCMCFCCIWTWFLPSSFTESHYSILVSQTQTVRCCFLFGVWILFPSCRLKLKCVPLCHGLQDRSFFQRPAPLHPHLEELWSREHQGLLHRPEGRILRGQSELQPLKRNISLLNHVWVCSSFSFWPPKIPRWCLGFSGSFIWCGSQTGRGV